MTGLLPTPLFSVVIPAYNAERFIGETLDAVARQTFGSYEIIVVDDGSLDSTGRCVEDWAERHNRQHLVLHRQANKGIGGARNAGVSRARGDFLAFLDADDLWMEQKLERVAAYLRQHADADLVCHDEWLVDNRGCRQLLSHGPYSRYEDLLFKGNSVSTSATVVRRPKVLEVQGFSEDRSFDGAEDYDLWLRLARAGCRFAYLQEVLGEYRVHDAAITGNAEDHCQDSLNVLDAHFRALSGSGLYDRYRMRKRRAAMVRGAVQMLMQQRNHKQASRLLMRAVKEDPLSLKTWVLAALNVARVTP